MASQGDKQIKFTFVIDERALNQTKTAIRQLSSEVKALVETMTRAGAAMGGQGGLFGGISGRAGAVSPQRESIRMPGAGGISSSLTQTVLANKNLLKSAADGSKDAFKAMTDGVRSAIRDQSAEIDKLQQKLRGLNQTYGAVKENYQQSMAPGGSAADRAYSERMMNEHRSQIFETTQHLNRAMAAKAELEGMDSNPYTGIMGRGRRNARARAAIMGNGWAEPNEFEGAAAPAGWMSRLGGIAGSLGYTGTGMGGGIRGLLRQAGPGLAIAGAYGFMHDMQMGRDAAVADHTLWQGINRQQRAMQTNQALGGLGMQIKGDTNMAMAAGSLTGSDIAGVVGREAMSAAITKAIQESGNTGGIKSTYQDLKDRAARILDASEENLSAQDQSILSMAKERSLAGLDVQAKERLVEQIGRKRGAMNMQDAADRDYFQSSFMNRISNQRAYGSGKMVQVGPGQWVSAAEMSGLDSIYSNEETNAMRANIRGSIGGRFAGFAHGALGLQDGGLGGAVQLYGNAAGYGNPGTFMRALSRAGGAGGQGLVDAPAISQVAQMYQAQMMGGDMFTSGASGMEGMLATVAMMGGDLRAARAAQGGANVAGAYMGGTTDNLQRGINVLASMRAGAGGVVTSEALMGMSEAQRMDIMRSGKLPEELRMQGVTMDMVKNYGQQQDKFLFARALRGQGLSSDVEAQMNAFQEKGFDSLSGLKGQDLKTAFKRLGVAAMRSGHGNSIDEGMAFMMQRAASENPALFKALQSGGIGVSVGGLEAAAKANADYERLRQDSNVHAGRGEEVVTAGSKGTRDTAQALVRQGTNLNGSVSAVTTELGKLANAISEARRAIESGGRVKTGAK